MTDEGVHEIQLNGKQLVFLFMTGTVAAVVVFLCGVMVGRGIQAPRVTPPIEASTDTGGDPTASARPAVSAPSGSNGATDGSSAPDEVLTYSGRLGDPTPPRDPWTARKGSRRSHAAARKGEGAHATRRGAEARRQPFGAAGEEREDGTCHTRSRGGARAGRCGGSCSGRCR